jgi:hypothetical protein
LTAARPLPRPGASRLPIERPTRFDLAVNLKAAQARGLEVPTSVLLRANAAIEQGGGAARLNR